MLSLAIVNPENRLQGLGSSDEFIYEGEFSVTSGTSQAIEIPYGAGGGTFVVIPTSGSFSVEYSLDTKARLIAGTATWQTYADSASTTVFTTTTSDSFNAQVKAFRLVAIGGTSRIVINAVYGA
jgi:hypothetical protein